MNQEHYVACGARLAQGDIVRAPSGIFVASADLADRTLLDAPGPPLVAGDPQGIAVTIPRLHVNREDVILRAWYQPAIVVSPDCAIDKNPPQVLLAPIFPLAALPKEQQDGVRGGTYLTAIDLPADSALLFSDQSTAPFPASYVDIQRIAPVAPHLLHTQRMVTLSAAQAERLRASWVRFVALREISSTGTIAAAEGKRVMKVQVAESSKKRHTVIMTFEDNSVVVLYQDPRRIGPQLQVVHLRNGRFFPSDITARADGDLVLRLENDDHRAWQIVSHDATIERRALASGTTTNILIRAMESPGEIVITNAEHRDNFLRLRFALPSSA